MPTIDNTTHWYSVRSFGAYNYDAHWVRLHGAFDDMYYVMVGNGVWSSQFCCVVDDFGNLTPVRKDGRDL